MQVRYRMAVPLVLLLIVVAVPGASAAGRVDLELVGEAQGSSLVFQQWMQALGRAGVRNVRIRSGSGSTRKTSRQAPESRPVSRALRRSSSTRCFPRAALMM